jgi:hypothetical protein
MVMPKTIRGICPDMTCDEVRIALKAQEEEIKKKNKEREETNKGLKKSKQKKLLKVVSSVSEASKVVAEKLGLKRATVRTIYRRNILEEPGSPEPTPKEITLIKGIKDFVVDDGNEVDCELKLIDGIKYLTIQEYRIGKDSGRYPTGNHFNFTIELVSQFKDFFDNLDVEELKVTEPPVDNKALEK